MHLQSRGNRPHAAHRPQRALPDRRERSAVYAASMSRSGLGSAVAVAVAVAMAVAVAVVVVAAVAVEAELAAGLESPVQRMSESRLGAAPVRSGSWNSSAA